MQILSNPTCALNVCEIANRRNFRVLKEIGAEASLFIYLFIYLFIHQSTSAIRK